MSCISHIEKFVDQTRRRTQIDAGVFHFHAKGKGVVSLRRAFHKRKGVDDLRHQGLLATGNGRSPQTMVSLGCFFWVDDLFCSPCGSAFLEILLRNALKASLFLDLLDLSVGELGFIATLFQQRIKVFDYAHLHIAFADFASASRYFYALCWRPHRRRSASNAASFDFDGHSSSNLFFEGCCGLLSPRPRSFVPYFFLAGASLSLSFGGL